MNDDVGPLTGRQVEDLLPRELPEIRGAHLYERVQSAVRGTVQGVPLPRGTRFPSSALVRRYGVSADTAMRVMRNLVVEEVLIYRPDYGYFVP